ncbi:hypothetical protein VT930_09620 [Mycobacterium sherrisii]|uniref:hypothetical protein n=1 Tax=Mycobacterium sherrisii TaxID=243061 RepID=UPI002DDD0504|nr:hypothetical protein [Mycobacterium sherrisii]MEC4763362.1 hypothetical protein [Mycobacterium sherrisii]
MVDVTTIRAVELLRVGEWDAATGPFAVTPADLESAVAAHRAGVLRRPVLKIGHTDPRFNDSFDGAPALGYIDNLRIVDGGNTLVGDYVNVPAQLAALVPYAYPDRSVEALRNYTAADGTVYSLVLTGLALLGATPPAVDTLQSLQDVGALYGIAAKHVTIRSHISSRDRDRAVAVAAARRRRTHRNTLI